MAKAHHSKLNDRPISEDSRPLAAGSENGFADREQIARLAYSYWVARGFQGGSPDEDWLRAEEELGRQAKSAGQVADVARANRASAGSQES